MENANRNYKGNELSSAFISPEQRNHLISRKAFELFLKRGMTPGRDIEDWNKAEAIIDRAIISIPALHVQLDLPHEFDEGKLINAMSSVVLLINSIDTSIGGSGVFAMKSSNYYFYKAFAPAAEAVKEFRVILDVIMDTNDMDNGGDRQDLINEFKRISSGALRESGYFYTENISEAPDFDLLANQLEQKMNKIHKDVDDALKRSAMTNPLPLRHNPEEAYSELTKLATTVRELSATIGVRLIHLRSTDINDRSNN